MNRDLSKAAGVAAIVLASFSSSFAGGKSWSVPNCTKVKGVPSVSYTQDQGDTVTPVDLPLGNNLATFGVVALDSANTLLAEFAATIWRSTDAGCTWRVYTGVESSGLSLVSAGDGLAYAFTFSSSPAVWRIDAKANPQNRIVRLPNAPADVLSLAASPTNGLVPRIFASDGQLYDLPSGSNRWAAVGNPVPASSIPLFYFAAFDPASLDHVVTGQATTGVYTTFDGGATWVPGTGLSATNGPHNSFSGSISPANSGVVYVMSLDLDESDAGAPSQGRHIYRSQDGGQSFTSVVDHGGAITLTNGPLLKAHPLDANVAYFVFGQRFGDPMGTFLYRYDHGTGQTTFGFDESYFGYRAMAFNPADPGTIYLGLEH